MSERGENTPGSVEILTPGKVSGVPLRHSHSVADLRAPFDAQTEMTVGIEEEVLVCDPDSHDLAPIAAELLRRLPDDPAFKGEMPAAQLELASRPARTVGEAAEGLAAARREALAAAGGDAVLAGAGAHPFAAPEGELVGGERYARIAQEFATIARRQLVFGLHVHVAVPGADRALAVFDALREHVPLLAALAANAPFYEGGDTGLASVRPKLCDLLPRQGVPPAARSWDALAADFDWGAGSGVVPDTAQWWWEARLHPRLGTVELRVPDTQTTTGETAAVAAVVHALVAHLAERHDQDDLPEPAPQWRIAENRWSACRHGVRGAFADVREPRSAPTAEVLRALLAELAPHAERLGCAAELRDAHGLLEDPPSERQRACARENGLHGLVGWLTSRFCG